MKITVIATTARAVENMDWLSAILEADADNEITKYVKVSSLKERCDKRSVALITQEAFSKSDAICFFSATGIAVRSIAPYIKNKTVDPAVIVIDEEMKFAISLLSGHLGGANELTLKLATITGATPIITTATDIEDKFAVDEFARANKLQITDMKLAKELSARVLEGKKVGFSSDIPVDKLKDVPDFDKDGKYGILVSDRTDKRKYKFQLNLYPRDLHIGIGMKRGMSEEDIRVAIDETLKKHKLSKISVKSISSIDIKKDEEGLKSYAANEKIKLKFYNAAQLWAVKGKFKGSDFVRTVTGVDNVCERAAKLSAGKHSELIVKKNKCNGITVAIARSL